MSSLYSIGQMNQLGDALEAAEYTPDEVTKLRNYPELSSFKAVLNGLAQIVVIKHIVDLDANPFVPDGWKVEEHIRGGKLEFDPKKVALHLDEGQQNGRWVVGNELRKKLKNRSVYNANLLEFYLTHPNLIPEEWKGKYTYFWGTIYRNSSGDLYVRCLSWGGQQWDWRCHYLDYYFSDVPAAVCK